MEMTYQEPECFENGWQFVIDAKDELTEIDSRFGDADHGVTMEKIAKAVIASQVGCSEIHYLLDSAAGAVMGPPGKRGASWYTYLDGLAQAAPASGPVSADDLKAMFASGLANLAALSKAKVGDKTMMDALIPATEALRSKDGSIQELFSAAAAAADKGADDTKNYVSKSRTGSKLWRADARNAGRRRGIDEVILRRTCERRRTVTNDGGGILSRRR